MNDKKFKPSDLHKLNDRERLKVLPFEPVRDMAGIEPSDTVLDIGAGTGFFSALISKCAEKVYACDISVQMVDWMRENLCTRHRNITALKMQECSVPLADNIADVICMLNVHHELEKPEKLLSECRRLLKRGGRIVIVDWKKQKMEGGPPLKIRCRPKEVKMQLDKTGFSGFKASRCFKKHFMVSARNGKRLEPES